MKIVFNKDFYNVYSDDYAAKPGRIESIINEINKRDDFDIINAIPAKIQDIERCHSKKHINKIKSKSVYDIACLSVGGAIMAAEIGLKELCFAIIRPPGHHAEKEKDCAFCYFNNMAIAIEYLKFNNMINTAFILDIDMHYSNGTIDILSDKKYIEIYNAHHDYDRKKYLIGIKEKINNCNADIIGVSAGFDNHINDWGGLLYTEDYYEIGRIVKSAALKNNCKYFAVLEGGYNHNVLGKSVSAFINGLS